MRTKPPARRNTDPRLLTVPLDFLERAPRKSELTQLRILAAARQCYASLGFSAATFERIGKKAGVSRPLIIRYFGDRDQLLLATIKHIRREFQEGAVVALRAQTVWSRQLTAYVQANLDWLIQSPEAVAVWLLFYHECAIRPEWKALNTELVRMGVDRIEQILRAGDVAQPRARAKRIQIAITGTLLSLCTEEPWDTPAKIRQELLDSCLRIARE